ncbi:MAG: hypothetical protein [Bacteriophage sp.]|nr:MAG: hypothetical protein [Bacteriophage sp.]
METTKIVNDPQQLTLFGERTPRAVIYKSESHKLHQAFNVKAGEKIVQGMPVALNEDGFIYPCTDPSTQVYLGVAVTDNVNPAYQPQRNFPVEVTVAVEGYMICNWVSNGTIEAGYVTPDGELLNDRFVKAVKANQDISTPFIALNPAEEANEVIQVLIK